MLAEQAATVFISIVLAGVLAISTVLAFRTGSLAASYTELVDAARIVSSLVSADVRESQTASCSGATLNLDSGRVVYSYDGTRLVRNGRPLPYTVEAVSWTCSASEVMGRVQVVQRRSGWGTVRGTVRRQYEFIASMRIQP